MRNRRLEVIDNPDIHLQSEKFTSPIMLFARQMKLHALTLGPRLDHRQKHPRQIFVNEQAFRRIARRRTLPLGVIDYRKRHAQIGLVVDINMANPLVVLQNRNQCRLAHRPDKPLAAARNGHINKPHAAHKFRHRLMRCNIHKQHRIFIYPGLRQTAAHAPRQRRIARECLLAAAQDDGVAAFDADRRRVGRHVRTRLVGEEDDAQGRANFAHFKALRTRRRTYDRPDRIGKGRDFAQRLRHSREGFVREG